MSELEEAILKALIVMLGRNLEGSPAADEIGDVAAIMTADLRRAGYDDRDSDVLTKALDHLGRTLTRWPTVAQLISLNRGSSAPYHQHFPRLAPPKWGSDEVAAREVAKMRSMLRRDPAPVTPPRAPVQPVNDVDFETQSA